jgi:hypothetical protein
MGMTGSGETGIAPEDCAHTGTVWNARKRGNKANTHRSQQRLFMSYSSVDIATQLLLLNRYNYKTEWHILSRRYKNFHLSRRTRLPEVLPYFGAFGLE